jgi:hypothetical protein
MGAIICDIRLEIQEHPMTGNDSAPKCWFSEDLRGKDYLELITEHYNKKSYKVYHARVRECAELTLNWLQANAMKGHDDHYVTIGQYDLLNVEPQIAGQAAARLVRCLHSHYMKLFELQVDDDYLNDGAKQAHLTHEDRAELLGLDHCFRLIEEEIERHRRDARMRVESAKARHRGRGMWLLKLLR